MKHSVLLLLAVLLLGCQGGSTKQTPTKEAYLNSMDSTEMESSLVFWCSDSAFAANPELMALLDTLYQHVNADSVITDAKTEDAWMAQYRAKLVNYFDSRNGGGTSLSDYEKVDSVLNEGIRLIELDDDWSTMGMIVKLDTENVFELCREYNLLAQLLERCEKSECKDLLYSERKSFEEMSDKLLTILNRLTHLNYWHGTIAVPIYCHQSLEVSMARNAFYRNLLNVLDGQYHGEKVDASPKQKLMSVCDTMIKDIANDSFEDIGNGEEDKALLNEYLEDAKTGAKALEPAMTRWLQIVAELDQTLTTGASRHGMENCASVMLIRWSGILKDIESE